jgi:glycine/D-amino acid oxidase-like deaminating enzyme
LNATVPETSHQLHIVVVGAGAFGGWTALQLRRRGARVTLIDAWGPGHARSSSGGETRIIRATYGTRAVYTRMALRALELWRAHDLDRRLLHETGVLWMFGDDDSFGHASADVLRDCGARLDPLTFADASRRYPQISSEGIRSFFFEPEAGYLFARRACADVVDCLVAEGGDYRLGACIDPVAVKGASLDAIRLLDRTVLVADGFVFACGPWLPHLFPDVVGANISATRQEVYYFAAPPGDARFTEPHLPVWMDFAAGSRAGQIYGIPASGSFGFKVADDTTGPPIDPTSADRAASPDGIARARAFLSVRFPDLANAPLVGSEVCQYENTPDAHLIVDRHPQAANAWIVGGGSGHGFKMGPAVGEMVASLVLDDAAVDPQFGLARFATLPRGGRWT